MRKLFPLLAILSLGAALGAVEPLTAIAQTVEDAEDDAENAKKRAEVASGLVDEAVADRERLETELAIALANAAELSAQLSEVGADLDRISSSMGFADGEVASIRDDLESHAVEAYMSAVSSPSIALVNTASIGDAIVASSMATEVVGDSQSSIDSLLARLEDLGDLRETFLAQQDEFNGLKAELDVQLEALAALYDEADAAVAVAVRTAKTADAEYREALGAVAAAKAREEERRRQEDRSTTTTTAPGSDPTRDSDGYLIGPWNHPASVERWRDLVAEHFPSHRVEQALRIMRCESHGDPNAYNPYSGASGLFQFIPSTWATASPRAGYSGASPFDPVANTGSAAWLANRYENLNLPYWMAWSCKRVLL